MAEYLVCYDYGQGGIWLYLKAENRSELASKYPKLTIFDELPPWWTLEEEALTRKIDPESPFWRNWLSNLE